MADGDNAGATRASAVVVRDLAQADVDRVAHLEREVFGVSAWSPTLVADEFKYGFSRWRGVDSDSGVDSGGGLAAYAVYGFEGDAFHLMNLVVDPAARR